MVGDTLSTRGVFLAHHTIDDMFLSKRFLFFVN